MPGLSERSLAKARRLLDEGKVREVTPTRTFAVQGDHGGYLVTVAAEGATCNCPAYGACSHIEAAMLAMGGELPARPNAGRPAPAPGHRLLTWSWRAALDADRADVTLVRISLGKPRWAPARAAACPYIGELAPHGLFEIQDDDEFERRYRERLDGFGVERIERRFREVAAANGGLPLVLLCFEADPAQCHRSTFARWWLERTGEVVPEFELPDRLEG